MVTKSRLDRPIALLIALSVAGIAMAFVVLPQSPPLTFADDSSESKTDATQADAPEAAPTPAPPTANIAQGPAPAAHAPTPVAPAEGVAGGAMETGRHKSGGSWYYLKSSGAMATSTWIDGYYVDASDAWVPSKTE